MGKYVVRTYHGFDVSMRVIQVSSIIAIAIWIVAIAVTMIVSPDKWLTLLIATSCYAAFVICIEGLSRGRIATEAYYVSLSDEEKAKFRQTEVMYRALDL